MIKITLGGKEVIMIADRNCPENHRYLLVSYKEYAKAKEDGAEEVQDSGPGYWNICEHEPILYRIDTNGNNFKCKKCGVPLWTEHV